MQVIAKNRSERCWRVSEDPTHYHHGLSSEEMNLGSYSLADLARELDDGACVGDHRVTQEEVIKGQRAIKKACEAVGSDESFFGDLL